MPDPERFVRPKEEMRISAASWNNLMLMMRDYNRGGRQGRKILGGKQRSLLKSNVEVYVQNLTGGPWDSSFKVVRLSNSLLPLNEDTVEQINKDPTLGAFIPLDATDSIAITQRPSDASPSSGLIVPAVVLGVTVVRVNMLESWHKWANPVPGEIDFMVSSEDCGQAKILYHVGSGEDSLAIVNLIGSGPCEIPEPESGSGSDVPPDYEAGGPGWVAGLCKDNCLKLTVRNVYGFCSNIDVGQEIPLKSDDGSTWESLCDFEYCDATPDSGGEECEGAGPAVFVRDSGAGFPKMIIDGVNLIYHAAGRSDGTAWIEFAGGQELCAGCPEPEMVSGPCGEEEQFGGTCCGPNGGCGSNYFIVRLECSLCTVEGWECPGWYCVVYHPDCCDTGEPYVEFVTYEMATNPDLEICSGPYETEEEALAVCDPPPDPSGPDNPCQGWYCCKETGTVVYIETCEQLLDYNCMSGDPCDGDCGSQGWVMGDDGIWQPDGESFCDCGWPVYPPYGIDEGNTPGTHTSYCCTTTSMEGPFETEEIATSYCGDTVENTCCEGDPIPETLNYTITNKTGLCECLVDSGSVSFGANGGDGWDNFDPAAGCPGSDCESTVVHTLGCQDGDWTLTGFWSNRQVTCNPFSVSFDVTTGDGTYTVTFHA